MEMGQDDISLNFFANEFSMELGMDLICRNDDNRIRTHNPDIGNNICPGEISNGASRYSTSPEMYPSSNPLPLSRVGFSAASSANFQYDGSDFGEIGSSTYFSQSPMELNAEEVKKELLEMENGNSNVNVNRRLSETSTSTQSTVQDHQLQKSGDREDDPSQPQLTIPPIVIAPGEVDNISVQLEKNQQCACRDCGKLFNSVWYLKQHAVKHSNSRPFSCRFCLKTYKFRSNLYQHKCPNRPSAGSGVCGYGYAKRIYTRNRSNNANLNKTVSKENSNNQQQSTYQQVSVSAETAMPFFIENNNQTNFPSSLPSESIGLYSPFAGYNQHKNGVGRIEYPSFYPQERGPSADRMLMSDISDYSGGVKKESITSSHLDTSKSWPYIGIEEGSSGLAVRENQLADSYIEAFIRENRNKMVLCRKCKCAFPSQVYKRWWLKSS